MSKSKTIHKLIRNLLILISPFILMIVVNETARSKISEKPYILKGVPTINSAEAFSDKCSWKCHNNTSYCKEHHLKYVKGHLKYIDPFYSGFINLLQSTGSYGLANILLLVIAWPLLMFYLLVKVLDFHSEIKKHKLK